MRRAEKVAAIVGAIPAPDRVRLLALAGYDECRLVALLKRTLSAVEDKLDARVVQRLVVGVGRGVNEVREYEDRDHSIELRAADMLLTLIGAYPSKSAGVSADGGPMNINITLRAEPGPQPARIVDVTPKSSK